MIIAPTASEIRHEEVKALIRENGWKRVLDVGGSLGWWTRDVISHIADLQPPYPIEGSSPVYLYTDIDRPGTWKALRDDCLENGLFDFVICTQTLEHSALPDVAVKLLSFCGKRGFVSVPNKRTELKRGISFGEEGLARCGCSGHWRGFLPHKWLVTVRDGEMWFWPKLNFLEYLDGIDEWRDREDSDIELSFFWEESIPIRIITDEALDFPDPQRACELYREELKIGI